MFVDKDLFQTGVGSIAPRPGHDTAPAAGLENKQIQGSLQQGDTVAGVLLGRHQEISVFATELVPRFAPVGMTKGRAVLSSASYARGVKLQIPRLPRISC